MDRWQPERRRWSAPTTHLWGRKTFRLGAAVAATFMFTAFTAGCRRGGGASSHPNILLISIDSLRADRLGVYGNTRDTSPTIDRLATEGVRFANAISPTSWTLPAHATLLSGLDQRHHQVINVGSHIAGEIDLLAEKFARAGYETIGLYSGPFLDPAYGFAQGFDEYVSCMSEATAKSEGPAAWTSSHSDQTNPKVESSFLAWLSRKGERPFFAFVHMWDVHYDYIPPPRYAAMFDVGYKGKLDGRDIVRRGFPLNATPSDVEFLLSLYDAEIRYTDDTLGHLIDALRERGLLENTAIVVTADHGEEFKDHGGKGHQHTLYEELIHVPLILWQPGRVPRGKVIEQPVSLTDVAPTILAIAGLEVPPGLDGQNLLPVLRGKVARFGTIISELYLPTLPVLTIASARAGSEKVILHPKGEKWEAYDLSADPRELHSLAASAPLRYELQRYVDGAKSFFPEEGAKTPKLAPEGLPDEVGERLRQLGYLPSE